MTEQPQRVSVSKGAASPPIRVAVIGAGAFGRNHLRVYRELESAEAAGITLTALVDPDPARRADATNTYAVPAFASTQELFNSGLPIDAASICVPTLHHAAVAADMLRYGADVLIEKPIAASLVEAQSIQALALSLDRIVAVGHLERFNPAVAALIPRLTKPMFFEAHRLSIFTPRSLDVDVVLDLMIHDLDIVLSLTHSPVREVRAVGIPILSRKADIANVRLEFESGCVANFTASRASTEQVRKLRLFQPREYLSLDFARQELLSIEVDPTALAGKPGSPTASNPGLSNPFSPQSHPSAGLNLQKLDLPRAEPLRLELEDFLHAVRTRNHPRVDATAGIAALALALEINQAIATHAQRSGLT